jgi:hypothetical protein
MEPKQKTFSDNLMVEKAEIAWLLDEVRRKLEIFQGNPTALNCKEFNWAKSQLKAAKIKLLQKMVQLLSTPDFSKILTLQEISDIWESITTRKVSEVQVKSIFITGQIIYSTFNPAI